MSSIILVDDPLWPPSSSAPAPKIVRSTAMRKLFDAGEKIGDIARRYDVPYRQAYKTIYYAPKVERARKPRPPQRHERMEPTTTNENEASNEPKAKPTTGVAGRRTRPKDAYTFQPKTREELEAMPKRKLEDHGGAAANAGHGYDSPYGLLIIDVLNRRFGENGWG